MKPKYLALCVIASANFIGSAAHALPCESEFRVICSTPGCDRKPEEMIPEDLRGPSDKLEKYINSMRRDLHDGHFEYYSCILAAKRSGSQIRSDSNDKDIDTITPPVPGCPRYLRKSLVVWRQVGNPQLNTWEIRNRSNKTLKVTFRDGGSNSSPDTLPPGQSTQVSLSANQVPSYVVRDFDELFKFNRANEAKGGKTLQCELAIRPR